MAGERLLGFVQVVVSIEDRDVESGHRTSSGDPAHVWYVPRGERYYTKGILVYSFGGRPGCPQAAGEWPPRWIRDRSAVRSGICISGTEDRTGDVECYDPFA